MVSIQRWRDGAVSGGSSMGTASTGRRVAVAVSLAATLGMTVLAAGPARATPESVAVVQAMQAAGITYKPTSSDVTWLVPYTTKSHGSFNVIVSSGSNLVVIFAFPMRKAEFNDTAAGLHALLSANHDLDLTKVGIDGDGDIFARIDLYADNLTSSALKRAIAQVAASNEELMDKLAPYRVTSRGK
jgi:hypothetical protein